jgi:hypothetical protein
MLANMQRVPLIAESAPLSGECQRMHPPRPGPSECRPPRPGSAGTVANVTNGLQVAVLQFMGTTLRIGSGAAVGSRESAVSCRPRGRSCCFRDCGSTTQNVKVTQHLARLLTRAGRVLFGKVRFGMTDRRRFIGWTSSAEYCISAGRMTRARAAERCNLDPSVHCPIYIIGRPPAQNGRFCRSRNRAQPKRSSGRRIIVKSERLLRRPVPGGKRLIAPSIGAIAYSRSVSRACSWSHRQWRVAWYRASTE